MIPIGGDTEMGQSKLLLGIAILGLSVTAARANPDGPAAPTTAEASALIHMDLSSKKALKAAMAGHFDEGQVNMLQAVAHQQVVAASCPGFAIDKAKFEAEMDLLYDDAAGKPRELSAEDRNKIDRMAMFGFGMAFGAQTTIAAYDLKAFCDDAEGQRGTMAHLIWAPK